MNERRVNSRLPIRLEVEHILADEARCECVATDLGPAGMRLVREGEGWGDPSHAWLEFTLPEGETIRALGQLRHEGTDEAGRSVRGFSFKYIYPAARARYDAFVGSLSA